MNAKKRLIPYLCVVPVMIAMAQLAAHARQHTTEPQSRHATVNGLKLHYLIAEVSNLAREGRFDYLFVEPTGISEPLPVAEPRLGRRTVLTFPLLPPPQKN